ncbi:MAG: hypothetical protein J5590_04480 [Clostridia bacterium]|nr:hypothetical protein [Clostridia bacterium]
MKSEYIRVPLEVYVLCESDGSFSPKKLLYHDKSFEITKTLSVRPKCPKEVGCIAPLEYTVLIDNEERKIYYEHETNTWFSVKEIKNEGASNSAQ